MKGRRRDIEGVCGKCRGKGYIDGYEFRENGICFWCRGFKSVKLFEQYEVERLEKEKKASIDYAISQIEYHRKKISEGNLVEYRKGIIEKELGRLRRLGVDYE